MDYIILSDGNCGSACAQFIKHASHRKVARVVLLGSNMGNSNSPYDIGSYAGGFASVLMNSSHKRMPFGGMELRFAFLLAKVSHFIGEAKTKKQLSLKL